MHGDRSQIFKFIQRWAYTGLRQGGECEIQIAPLPARSCLRLELMKRSEVIHLLLYSRAGVHIIPKIADFLDPKIIFCPQLKNILNSTNTFAPMAPN